MSACRTCKNKGQHIHYGKINYNMYRLVDYTEFLYLHKDSGNIFLYI